VAERRKKKIPPQADTPMRGRKKSARRSLRVFSLCRIVEERRKRCSPRVISGKETKREKKGKAGIESLTNTTKKVNKHNNDAAGFLIGNKH